MCARKVSGVSYAHDRAHARSRIPSDPRLLTGHNRCGVKRELGRPARLGVVRRPPQRWRRRGPKDHAVPRSPSPGGAATGVGRGTGRDGRVRWEVEQNENASPGGKTASGRTSELGWECRPGPGSGLRTKTPRGSGPAEVRVPPAPRRRAGRSRGRVPRTPIHCVHAPRHPGAPGPVLDGQHHPAVVDEHFHSGGQTPRPCRRRRCR